MFKNRIRTAHNNSIALILCFKRADWATCPRGHRAAFTHSSQKVILRDHCFFHAENALIKADIHLLRHALQRIPVVEGDHRSNHSVQSCDIIRQCKRRTDRRTVWVTLHIGHTGKRLQRRTESRQMCIRAGLSIACYMCYDDVGIRLAHFLDTDAPLIQRTCFEVFDDHIALRHQI